MRPVMASTVTHSASVSTARWLDAAAARAAFGRGSESEIQSPPP